MKEQELIVLWDQADQEGLPVFRLVDRTNNWEHDTLIRPLRSGLVIMKDSLEGHSLFLEAHSTCWVLKLWDTGFYPKPEIE